MLLMFYTILYRELLRSYSSGPEDVNRKINYPFASYTRNTIKPHTRKLYQDDLFFA